MKKSAREKDTNGFFEVKNNPLSKVGVFDYSGAMIGAEDKSKIYKVYRPASELKAKECIDSFKLLPFVDDHTMLGKDATPAEQKGVQGVIGEDVYFKDGVLYGNIKVFSEALKSKIENGKIELSCGYRCSYVFEEGTYEGQKYEAIQKDIRGNHLALVDEGRMGKEVAVLDSMVFTLDGKEIIMEEEIKKLQEALAALTEKVSALTKDADEKKAADKKAKDEEDAAKKAKDETVKKDEEAADKKAKDEEVKEDPKKEAGMDAALIRKEILKEIGEKQKLYEKISPIVGTFDSSDMSLEDMGKYAVEKLKLDCEDGAEISMLNGYITALKTNEKVVTTNKAVNDDIEKYIKGE